MAPQNRFSAVKSFLYLKRYNQPLKDVFIPEKVYFKKFGAGIFKKCYRMS